ncbi:hypothetical protein CRG98_014652 [Punica granatum]|uniref:Uncharacterized protein n=1 Tax=Punica granatum TaxID=22663 RepID=A0A2I0K8S6_PUNGR|nr:hypothetical protein CRG98_014652 [Punica granatum]
MARLAKVAGGNDTCGNSDAPGGRHWDPIVFAVGTRGWRLKIENLSPEMDLGGPSSGTVYLFVYRASPSPARKVIRAIARSSLLEPVDQNGVLTVAM